MSIRIVVGMLSAVAVIIIAALIRDRKRRGELSVAANLVVFGAVVLALEHPQFALAYTVPIGVAGELPAGPVGPPHARLHFFMAGIYALMGLALVAYIGRTWLLAGRPEGWRVVLFALAFGGGLELVMDGLWYQHGSPLYLLFGVDSQGWGWPWLYVGYLAWGAALAVSHGPIFRRQAGSANA